MRHWLAVFVCASERNDGARKVVAEVNGRQQREERDQHGGDQHRAN